MNESIEQQQPAAFPADDSLCEACGYSLRGLSRSGDCPECGALIGLSDPARRTGLPWQRRPGWRSWLATCHLMITRPGDAFTRLRIAEPAPGLDRHAKGNRTARLFLLTVAFGTGTIFHQIDKVIFRSGGAPGLGAVLAPLVLVMLSYIEAVGITYFSRKRGWRVPFPLAERIVCYASIGWLPAMFVMPPLILLAMEAPFLPRWATWMPLKGELTDWLIVVIVGGVVSLWFETLVWLGVRRVRFANA